MTKQSPKRMARLKVAAKLLNDNIEVIKRTPKKQREAFLHGFCFAKIDEDIIFQMASMFGRSSTIVEDLNSFIEKNSEVPKKSTRAFKSSPTHKEFWDKH
jgi:hypothetical protein